MPDLPISRQMGCPVCTHEHLYLDCEWCLCDSHIQQGIYLEES